MSTAVNPKLQKFTPVAGEPWRESWHNNTIKFFECPPEHQGAWLDETAKWLMKGRRWPTSPTERMAKHCAHWWPNVYRIMLNHGWWPLLQENDLHGYLITWCFVPDDCSAFEVDQKAKASEFKVSHGAPYAHYVAICGAAICRRKAKYYGLWQLRASAPPR